MKKDPSYYCFSFTPVRCKMGNLDEQIINKHTHSKTFNRNNLPVCIVFSFFVTIDNNSLLERVHLILFHSFRLIKV